MKIKLSIRIKLAITFLLFALIPLVIFGYLFFKQSEEHLREEIGNNLLSLAESKEGQVFSYLESARIRTVDFSSDGFIRDFLREAISSGSEESSEALNDYLIKNKLPLDPESIVGIIVMDMKGVVVGSTDEGEIGKNESKDSYFIGGKKDVFFVELREHKHFGLDYTFVFSSPLTDTKTGETIGVIAIFFDPERLHSMLTGDFQLSQGAISGRLGIHNSLDFYMVNRDKKMFVSLRNAPEKIIVDTLPVRKCLNNNQEILEAYKDYNGEEVMGASMCFVDKKWVLLVEVPTTVAFSSIDDLKLFLVTLVLAIFITAVLGSLLISSRITNPVKKLRDAVGVFSSGKLDERVDIRTGDEIQQLGEDFNEMAEKLSSLYGSLEQKIEEKTHELRGKIKELEKFKEFTVGREIKMIEIKKEMEALKKELENKKLKMEEK